MFLLDDILLSPLKGSMWIFKKIYEAAEHAQVESREQLVAELTQLHRQLETGQITEEEFDEREQHLLDQIDALDGAAPGE
jgi:hypothetical protein